MTQIDYILGAAIFFSAFLASTILVLNYASAAEADLEVSSLRTYALSLLELTDRAAFGTKILEQGIGTIAWRAYASVNNPGQATTEISRLRLSEVGFPNVDYNSATAYVAPTYGPSLSISASGEEIRWSSEILPGRTIYTVWFDDDSSFSPRTGIVPGGDNLTQVVWRPEPVWIIQHNALQALSAVPYQNAKEQYNFRIRLIDIESSLTAFSYGLVPTPGQNVVVASKPALYQKANADIGLATMTVEVWE